MSESDINKIIVFRNNPIRSILHQNEWWFSELYEKIVQLKLRAIEMHKALMKIVILLLRK